jgi:hypothetical protein
MARTTDLLAGLAVGAFVGVGASFALSPAPASADAAYAAGTETISSNKAAKGDLMVTSEPTRVARKVFEKPVEVRQIQVLGQQNADIVLLDGEGRIVYRSEPGQQRTLVARDVAVPSTALRSSENNRIDVAFRTAGRAS